MADELLKPLRALVGSPEFNSLLQQVMEQIGAAGLSLNSLRKSRGLKTCPNNLTGSYQFQELTKQEIPLVVPISAVSLGREEVARLQEHAPTLILTDFIFLRLKEESLPKHMEDFIQKARNQRRKIVALAFSSMPVGEIKILKAAVEICEHCMPEVTDPRDRHHPAVIAMTAGQVPSEMPTSLKNSVEQLEAEGRLLVQKAGVPFGALFKRLDGIVLHGGLGVTSEAMLCGIPIIISGILLMDQRYWASRIHALGTGPPGFHIRGLVDRENPQVPPKIVDFMNAALDERADLDGKFCKWRIRAKEVQKEIEDGRQGQSADGCELNAKVLFENTDKVVRIAYEDAHGCRQLTRQFNCVCCSVVSCVRCLVCKQVKACLKCQLRCVFCLCSWPRALWERCCPRRAEAGGRSRISLQSHVTLPESSRSNSFTEARSSFTEAQASDLPVPGPGISEQQKVPLRSAVG
eukprot:gnl/MRDRNA2_/MRDRNA2_56069_c0_seq1.p1 gnl/MRDRNA2_/MRDRNA2_56069_c0~~gnl/MRDRNA2_/MRDRNA2_56069_c0_seq1.p1  ORF type:complete len:470 (+),score=77.77 gnl/MRDRNA2_/MRDRNA2_56069_c0_seq1:24-1412(+)